MTAETSNARGDWVLERLRGVLEHGKMGDKCLIAPDLVTAAIASLSAQQSPAEAQPVAKLVNRKDADGGKTTTFIRPTSLGMDLPLGEYPLHLHPPPSAPVGVEWTDEAAHAFRKEVDSAGAHWHPWPVRFRAGMKAAIAAQHQEPTTCKHDFRRDEDHGGACCQLCGEVRQ